METRIALNPISNNIKVVSLPMRDGNKGRGIGSNNAPKVVSLPMRDGNKVQTMAAKSGL